MKKAIRTVFISLSSLVLLRTLAAPIAGSHMQGYYKGQIDAIPANTQALLEKKQIWVTIGETKVFLILLVVSLLAFVVSEWIIRIKNCKKH